MRTIVIALLLVAGCTEEAPTGKVTRGTGYWIDPSEPRRAVIYYTEDDKIIRELPKCPEHWQLINNRILPACLSDHQSGKPQQALVPGAVGLSYSIPETSIATTKGCASGQATSTAHHDCAPIKAWNHVRDNDGRFIVINGNPLPRQP